MSRDELVDEIARILLTSYRFVLAYPNSLDTVAMDAEGLVETIEEAGWRHGGAADE
jgi:hypothetical protein